MDANHKTPTYRRHRSGGLDRAFVELNGRRIYLGRYGSPESREKYDREVANWLANGRRLRPAGPNPTLLELLTAFWDHAQQRYRNTHEALNYRPVIKRLRRLYGRSRVRAFSAGDLEAVRARMLADGWSRTYTNRQVKRLRSIFRWGVGKGLVPAEVLKHCGHPEETRYSLSGSYSPSSYLSH